MIVALDSTDEAANYIHIADAKENANYYCPCCKGLIKPRAYKKDVKYQVQPHYYHESGGCSEESFVHYICKTWLFEKGCKFIVSNIEYEVDSIETEKTLHTKFGDYRPDIIVNTESGKTFFFEIKYSNCKTELYAPKWDELGNDVVEVDTREFINNKHGCTIPEFKLIYSNGECFIKSYSRTDYEDTIAKRKLEWKRQDKLNYKIQWERLDWFWEELCKYKNNCSDIVKVSELFKNLDFKDMDFCIKIIKKMKCIKLFECLVPIINDAFLRIIQTYNIEPYISLSFNQISERIFYIEFEIYKVNNCKWINSYCLREKVAFYGYKLLEKVIRIISSNEFKNYSKEICPCYEDIGHLYYKHNLNDTMIHFYVNERSAVYWDYYYGIGCELFDDINNIEMSTYLKNRSIKTILTTNPKNRTLTKKVHFEHMKSCDIEYQCNLKTNLIKKRINNCKNGLWVCEEYDGMDALRIQFGSYHGDSFYLYDIPNKSKQQIFTELKGKMNHLVLNAYNSYSFGKCRLIEVSNDK